ncbi:MAG TPA: gliding motility-associated protein GldE [Saprospiraceae bacterium]|nr:gliding motility-associated protein GldE [Saprospiraceae bacterium]
MDPEPFLSILPFGIFALMQPDWFVVWGGLLLLVLIALSAMISGSEIAFFSYTPADISELEQAEDTRSKKLYKLIKSPRTLLATILITNNLVNITIVIFSEIFLRHVLSQEMIGRWAASLIQSLHLQMGLNTIAEAINFTITVVGVTFLLVLMGEVMPKVLAYADYKLFSRKMTPMLVFLDRLLHPLSASFVNLGHFIEKKLTDKSSHENMTKEEIDKAIDLTTKASNSTKDEIGILKSIVKFGDVTVKEIMQPRIDIQAIDIESSFSDLLNLIKETGFSRFPVYEGDIDVIKGMFYVKDLIGYFHESEDFDWRPLIRKEVKYVPNSKLISDLLKEFKEEHIHMGIVIDEYGATDGLITLEDIMEEVVGEIQDEFDEDEEIEYKKINDYTYVFDGKTLISDFCKIIHIDSDFFDDVRDEADSLAGMLLEELKDFPKKGTVVDIKGFKFKVLTMGKRRIGEIRIVLPNGEESMPAAR